MLAPLPDLLELTDLRCAENQNATFSIISLVIELEGFFFKEHMELTLYLARVRVVFLFMAHHNSGTSRHSRKHKRFMCISLKTDIYVCMLSL